jgi:uncharacterized protein YecE (DUF72 family)
MLPVPKIPESYTTHLKIGTCSWKYDSWKGLVYSPDRVYGPHEYLPDYARYFNTVEIDQWFWSLFPTGVQLPRRGAARQYADSVPDGFTFSVKAPNAITLTHQYAKQPKGSENHANDPNPLCLDVGLFERFIEAIEPIHAKLGPIMFQFEYLNKQKMSSRQVFLDKLHEFFEKAPKGFMYAVETRNPNYLHEDFFEFLRGHGLGCVLLDGYFMPPISEVVDKFNVRTANFSVIRLHGPDRADIEERTGSIWNRIVDPKDRGLKRAVDLVRANAGSNMTTYINVNNHYEGSAPLTIERLIGLL